MRVISGKYRGLKIPLPSKGIIRPTTDRNREALFNILVHRIDFDSIEILDLFAGSGAMSIEFASRGAEKIDAVELNFHVFKQVKRFLEDATIGEITLHKADAYKFLERTKSQYDLIFADPPYADPKIQNIVQLILDQRILKEEGVLIIEHASHIKWEIEPIEQRVYGQTVFSFFTK